MQELSIYEVTVRRYLILDEGLRILELVAFKEYVWFHDSERHDKQLEVEGDVLSLNGIHLRNWNLKLQKADTGSIVSSGLNLQHGQQPVVQAQISIILIIRIVFATECLLKLVQA